MEEMQVTPTKEWLKLWMENREQLSCQQDLSEYFEQEEVAGCPVRTVRVGLCPLPSGSLVAFDPCAAADCPPQPYLVTAPVGNYPLELCIAFPQGESPVCAAARLRFNYEQPVHFEQALTGLEDYSQLTTGNFGFVSKSALGCLCDQVTLQKLQDYLDGRVSARSPQNLLEQLFLPMVQQQNHPGSWADWTLPENQCRLPVFTTGWGAGEYPVYWGQDAEGRVCQLVSWFVDLHAMQGADPVVEEALEELEEALIWEDDCYKGQVCLEDWDAFFEQEQPIDLMVRPGNCDDQQVIDACRYLLTEQYRLLDVMMTGLFEQYPLMQLQYGYTRADNHPEMPNLLDKNDLWQLLRPLRLVLDVQSGMVSAAFWASWNPQQGVGISVCGEDVTALDTAAIVPVWEQPEPKAEPEEDEESEQPQPRQEGEQEDERVD